MNLVFNLTRVHSLPNTLNSNTIAEVILWAAIYLNFTNPISRGIDKVLLI